MRVSGLLECICHVASVLDLLSGLLSEDGLASGLLVRLLCIFSRNGDLKRRSLVVQIDE